MRLFVAVWPDASTSARVAALELGGTRGVRFVDPRQLHVTLRFLGEVDERLVPPLGAALAAAAGVIGGPVHCEVGPATRWFPGGRVLQVPVAGLDGAAEAVRAATSPIVAAPDGGERFAGHLTVARSRARRLDRATRSALSAIPLAAAFEADELDLVASRLCADGPHYTSIMTVALRA